MKKPGKIRESANEIILESISEGVFTVDHNWKIMSFNRAAEEITGTPRKEAIGRYCWEVFRSNMCEGDCALKRTMKEGKSFVSTATYIINSEQKKVPIGVSTSPLVDEKGDVLGGVETFRDHSLVEELRQELQGSYAAGSLVSRSESMKPILSILPQVAESDSTVLIEGETGTGKEVLARNLHQLSGRRDGPFIAINCGALPDNLLESELFGYKAGAFTGADKDKPGLFEAASHGTILLDEIGDTSAAFQVRLLRLLEEKEYQPLGSIQTYKTDARILAATNRDLLQMVDEGSFRSDLYYRINIIRLSLPPLRQRLEDLPLLIEGFIGKLNRLKGREVRKISMEAMGILTKHSFPGNIRELENSIEHAFILCSNGEILPSHLPPALLLQQEQAAGTVKTMESCRASSEKDSILTALKRNNYSRQATAKELGIHKTTLFRKIKKYQIVLP